MKKLSGYYDKLPEDDRLLAYHIADMAEICEKKYIPRFSVFLDGRQVEIAKSVLNYEGFENFMFYGGYEGALRVILGVFPPYVQYGKQDFPMKNLVFRYREENRLTHRDFLGAFMACGINRNMLGDIIVNEGYTVAFVYDTVCGMISSEMRKVGSVGVKISEEDEPAIYVKENFKEIKGTVSSMRLDCVVSLATRISRENAARIIRASNVSLNSGIGVSVSSEVKSGDVFSVRGYGKFILSEVSGKSKKDRFCICIKKYI